MESIFNNRIHFNDSCDFLFNSFTHASMLVKSSKSFEELSSNPQTYSWLEQNGFLAKSNEDCLVKIKEIFEKNTGQTNRDFILTINPTLNCNFRCWYYYENHNDKRPMSSDILTTCRKAIAKIFMDYDSISIMFFGGEPLLEYKSIVLPVMEFCKQQSETRGKPYIISFTTNGFLLSDQIIADFKHFSIGHFQITLDGGREFHNKTRVSNKADSFKTITENIKKLANNGLEVIVRLNVTAKNITSCLEIPSYLSDISDDAKKRVKFTVQQVWQDKAKDISTKTFELYKQIAENGFKVSEMINDRLNNPCYGDKENSAVINFDGKVYKCTAINFEEFIPDGEIKEDGSISMDSYMLDNRKKLWETKCKDCRILPMCCGGCAKTLMDRERGGMCPYPDDEAKDKFVIRAIEEQYYMKQLEEIYDNQD